MKNRLLILGIFNVLLCLSAVSDVFAQRLLMTLERVPKVGIGSIMPDSLEGVGPDEVLYLSVYGNNMTGLIAYSLLIEFDKSKFKDNVNFIFTRRGDENPLESAGLKIQRLETLGDGTTYYSAALALSENATGFDLTDWTFFGRLRLETRSTFSVSDGVVFDFRSPNTTILTNPGLVQTSVTDVNTAYINLITDIDDDNDGGAIPESYSLGQNYPNPFNPSTTIPFEMNITGNTKITIYNILGQEVAIALNSFLPAGKHTIQFDANSMSSGIYFYKLEVNDFTEMKRFVLIR